MNRHPIRAKSANVLLQHNIAFYDTLCYNIYIVSEKQIPQLEDQAQAQDYLQQIRQSYREGDAYYKGTLNEYQRMAEEISSEEARVVLNGVMAGIIALGGARMPDEHDDIERAGITWGEFSNEFGRALARVETISERLERKGLMTSYAELGESDRVKVAAELLSDFQVLNALRFGADGSGLPATRTRTIEDEDGGLKQIEVKIGDKDKASTEKGIDRNMAERGYRSKNGNSPAIKLSPAEYRDLRRQYPLMDKDTFDRIVSISTDAAKALETEED